MIPRYFKLVEIDQDEFVEATGENLDCCQFVVMVNGTAYAAIDESEEDELQIDLSLFEEDAP